MRVGALLGSSYSILNQLSVGAIEKFLGTNVHPMPLSGLDPLELEPRFDLLLLHDLDLENIEATPDLAKTLAALCQLNIPVVVLCLHSRTTPQDLRVPNSILHQLIRKSLESHQRIGVADPHSLEQLKTLVPEVDWCLVGSPVLLAKTKPLIQNERIVTTFAPCPQEDKQLAHLLVQVADRFPSSFLLVGSEADFSYSLKPSTRIFFSPRNPSYFAVAAASAKRLVSNSIEPILLALEHGVESLLVTNNPCQVSLAKKLGLPVLEIEKEITPEQLMEIIPRLAQQPNEAGVRQYRCLVENLRQFLRPFVKTPWPAKRIHSRRETVTSEPLRVACVMDSSYVPFFFGLFQNLLRVHTNPMEFHVAAMDSGVAERIKSLANTAEICLYPLEKLCPSGYLERLRSLPIEERAWILKPLVLRQALHAARKPVLLCDLDILFLRSPARLFNEFGAAHLLLFPQFSDRYDWLRHHGLFNSGLVAARKGAERALDFWCEMCLKQCTKDPEHVYFGDQIYLDLAAVYFDNVAIYKGADENIAGWNLNTIACRIESNDSLSLTGFHERPIGSFHCAGRDKLGVFEAKYCWDQLSGYYGNPSAAIASTALQQNTLEQLRTYWPRLDFVLNLESRLQNRLHLPVSFSQATLEKMVAGGWISLTRWLEWGFGFYRRLRKCPIAAGEVCSPWGWWIDLQRQTIIQRLPSDTNKTDQTKQREKANWNH